MKIVKRIEPYIYIVSAFALDLFILAYGTLRHLILPSTKRKGNLLSSLFHLFTELTERLLGLKQELTRSSWTYGKKYVRLGMLALTWALFILSSFEWTGTVQTTSRTAPTQETVRTASPESTSFRRAAPLQPIASVAFRPIINISFPNTTPAPSSPPRWLFLRKLLI